MARLGSEEAAGLEVRTRGQGRNSDWARERRVASALPRFSPSLFLEEQGAPEDRVGPKPSAYSGLN